METKDKLYRVTYEAELIDSNKLIDSIVESEWLKPDTILVNCFPQYSSRLTYLLSHKLSFLNLDEPFEVIDLRMPSPNMVQIWDPDDMMFKMYSNYLSSWIWRNIDSNRFLFVGTDAFLNFPKLKSL